MKRYFVWFNIVLLVLLAGTGCQSLKKKDASTLFFHLETPTPDPTGRSMAVEIGENGMFTLNVEKDPFLNASQISKASIVKAMGGFQIMIEFNRQGKWILENYTTASRGRRIAIFSAFGKARWLAAPTITRTIKDGVFVFTPDSTREEAERLVKGLNDLAKEFQKNNP